MLIYVEWTSASFSADLIDPAGRVVDAVRQPLGVNQVKDGAFEARFLELVPADWRQRATVAYLSGMVTGRGGWLETAFAAVPAGLEDLAAQGRRLTVAGLPLVFLCGVSTARPLPDVMRGEEVKALAAAAGAPSAMVVLPGGHTKYVAVAGGRITGLATCMGGEVANLLRRDSLIGRLIPEGAAISEAGFARGLAAARAADLPGGLLRRLFSARSLALFEQLPREDIAGYITGLVTGSEIAEAMTEWPLASGPVLVAGHGAETTRYLDALQSFGIAARAVEVDTAAALTRLAAAVALPA